MNSIQRATAVREQRTTISGQRHKSSYKLCEHSVASKEQQPERTEQQAASREIRTDKWVLDSERKKGGSDDRPARNEVQVVKSGLGAKTKILCAH